MSDAKGILPEELDPRGLLGRDVNGILPELVESYTVGGILTAETFATAMLAVMEDTSRELLCPPHVVNSREAERLRREGGTSFCGACMRPFHMPPPSER